MNNILGSELDDIFDDDDIIELENNIEEYKLITFIGYLEANDSEDYFSILKIPEEGVYLRDNTLLLITKFDDNKSFISYTLSEDIFDILGITNFTNIYNGSVYKFNIKILDEKNNLIISKSFSTKNYYGDEANWYIYSGNGAHEFNTYWNYLDEKNIELAEENNGKLVTLVIESLD